MNNKIIVSVVLPTYNRAYLLSGAISSVLNQTFQDFELIIVDDGSTDNTKEVVENFQKKDNRIKYIRNEENLGIQKTLNKGIGMSEGKYIARIDDDDEWIDNNKLKNQVDFLELNQDHVLVGTGAVVVDENNKEIFRYLCPKEDNIIRKSILSKNCFLHPSVVFKKESFLAVGGYDESSDVRHIEDYDLWFKLGIVGKFANLNIYAVKLKNSGKQISFKNQRKQLNGYFLFIKKYKDSYPGYYYALVRAYLRLFLYGYLGLNFISKMTAFISRKKYEKVINENIIHNK